MRIGVLTLPLSVNYGGILQAYALTRFLKSMGHETFLIDRQADQVPSWRAVPRVIKRTYEKYLGGKRTIEIFSGIIPERGKSVLERNTGQFVRENIHHRTEKYRSSRALARRIGSYRLDAVVVGSDQVWRPGYTPNIADYFLDFLGKNNPQTKRIAYAASFGTDRFVFSESRRRQCSLLLRAFDAVSVREDSGVELCKRYFGVYADQVVDPTLLLPRSTYSALLHHDSSGASMRGNPSLFAYMLDTDAMSLAAIENLASKSGLEMTKIRLPTGRSGKHSRDRVAPPVEEWIRGFSDAAFVVTDSFHGCVFSIIFNKPFVALGNETRGMARFESLLKVFGLEERLLHDVGNLPLVLFSPIDWATVNSKIDNEREKADLFLRRSLSSSEPNR